MKAVVGRGGAVGGTVLYGPGAGGMPTASAVVSALVEIAREIRRGTAGRVAPLSYLPEVLERKPLVPLGELFGRFYLRFTALDRSGVLGHLTGVLGENEIGIESILQKGRGEAAQSESDGATGSVPVCVLTHPTREAAVRSAEGRIDERRDVAAPTRLLRMGEGF